MIHLSIDPDYYSRVGWILIWEAFQPFVPRGDAHIFMEDSYTLSSTWGQKVAIEFPKMPHFNFEVFYPLEEFDKLRFEIGALSIDFGLKVAHHIRHYRIKPGGNIKLGEN